MYFNFYGPVTLTLGSDNLLNILESIMRTQAQLVQDISAISTAVKKIGSETSNLITKFNALQEKLDAAGNVNPEVEAAMDDLNSQIKTVDELVPDVTAAVDVVTSAGPVINPDGTVDPNEVRGPGL